MVFAFLSLYIAFILIAVMKSDESLLTPRRRNLYEVLAIYKELLRNRLFILYGLGMILPSFALFAYFTASPFLFQVLVGLSPSEFGFLALYIGAAIVLFSLVNTQLLKIYSIRVLIRFGFSLIMLSGLGLLAVHFFDILGKWTLLCPVLLLFCSIPFALGNSSAMAIGQVKEHFGSAGAVMATLQFLSGCLGSWLFTYLPETSCLPTAICLLVISCLCHVIFFFIPNVDKPEHS